MADFNLTVTGIEELRAALEAMGNDLCDALEEAVYDGSLVVVRAAQENSARGGNNFPHRRTGNLFRSIPAISPVLVSKTQTRVAMAVGSAAEYANRLERGFVGRDSRGRRYHQAPRPYLRPAADEHTAEVEAAIRKRMSEIIKRYT